MGGWEEDDAANSPEEPASRKQKRLSQKQQAEGGVEDLVGHNYSWSVSSCHWWCRGKTFGVQYRHPPPQITKIEVMRTHRRQGRHMWWAGAPLWYSLGASSTKAVMGCLMLHSRPLLICFQGAVLKNAPIFILLLQEHVNLFMACQCQSIFCEKTAIKS